MLSLKEHKKLKGLLEVVSSSVEFESVPIRRHEDALQAIDLHVFEIFRKVGHVLVQKNVS